MLVVIKFIFVIKAVAIILAVKIILCYYFKVVKFMIYFNYSIIKIKN
jgi:hypothetical protein